MRVAIDGSFLSLPPSGIGTYLRHLTASLVTVDPGLDLRLIQPQWDDRATQSFPRSLVDRVAHDRRVRRLAWDLVGSDRIAARAQPDLVHIPQFAAPWRPRAPLVVTIHDVIPLVLPDYQASKAMRVNLAVMSRTVRAADLVFAPSQAAADDIRRYLTLDRTRISITPEAAGDDYQPSEHPEVDREIARRFGVTGRYIFNVGGFDVRKNLPVLLDAFARLQTMTDESLRLVIAGAPHSDNPAVFPPLKPEIERRGLAGSVVLTGRISDSDKLALYRGAALYATPSLYEGFGLTALEAMACGIPTVVSNRTSLPEVVGDGGLVTEPDGIAFAEAMHRILSDPDVSTALRQRGLARARMFSWKRTAELTLDGYRAVIASRNSRGD